MTKIEIAARMHATMSREFFVFFSGVLGVGWFSEGKNSCSFIYFLQYLRKTPTRRVGVSFYYIILRSLAEYFKFVAYAPDGFDDPLVRDALELFAESLDVDVNGSGVAEIVESPYLVKKLVTGEYSVVI